MEIIKDLKKLGFGENKVKVYLAVLELGAAPASEVAKKAGLRRTTAYKLLEELVNDELVEIDLGAKIKIYLAQSPKTLVKIFDEKKKNADALLPQLIKKFSETTHKPIIRFYNGLRGIKKTFEDALSTKEKILYTFSPIKNVLDYLGPTFARHYIAKRKKYGIFRKALRQISDKKSDLKNWEFYASDQAVMREVKFLPPDIEFHTLIQIYDDKISIISFEKEKYAFIIKNEELAVFMKDIFKILWSIAKK